MVISTLPKAFKLNLETQPLGMLSGVERLRVKPSKHWSKNSSDHKVCRSSEVFFCLELGNGKFLHDTGLHRAQEDRQDS